MLHYPLFHVASWRWHPFFNVFVNKIKTSPFQNLYLQRENSIYFLISVYIYIYIYTIYNISKKLVDGVLVKLCMLGQWENLSRILSKFLKPIFNMLIPCKNSNHFTMFFFYILCWLLIKLMYFLMNFYVFGLWVFDCRWFRAIGDVGLLNCCICLILVLFGW